LVLFFTLCLICGIKYGQISSPGNFVCKDISFHVHVLVLIFEALNKKYDKIYEQIYELTAVLDRLEKIECIDSDKKKHVSSESVRAESSPKLVVGPAEEKSKTNPDVETEEVTKEK
jgi:hypothetical protein